MMDPCEYSRCGTTGNRPKPRPWKARRLVVLGKREWRVCEHCAILLERHAREEGVGCEDWPLTEAPARHPSRAKARKRGKPERAQAELRASGWSGKGPPARSAARARWEAAVERNRQLAEARAVERAAELRLVEGIVAGRRSARRRKHR